MARKKTQGAQPAPVSARPKAKRTRKTKPRVHWRSADLGAVACTIRQVSGGEVFFRDGDETIGEADLARLTCRACRKLVKMKARKAKERVCSADGCERKYRLRFKDGDPQNRKYPHLCPRHYRPLKARDDWKDAVHGACKPCKYRGPLVAITPNERQFTRLHCPKCSRVVEIDEHTGPAISRYSRQFLEQAAASA